MNTGCERERERVWKRIRGTRKFISIPNRKQPLKNKQY
jgi:hypothetical protein